MSSPIQVTQPTDSPINETPRKSKHRPDRTLWSYRSRCGIGVICTATVDRQLRKLLRGSRNFDSREEYVAFVEDLLIRANDNRRKNFLDDLAHLNRLPDERLDTDDIIKGVRVSRSSTINVRTNTYSVPSRLIGQLVDLRIGAEQITVTHYGHLIQTMPRLVGKQLAAINYRHIIDSLVRKSGAFANYRTTMSSFVRASARSCSQER